MLTMIMPVKWRLSSGTAGEKTHSNGVGWSLFRINWLKGIFFFFL